jgi:choline dehydrogenase-like flavoprotein
MNQIYDAIVVGSGITGGWAAKELCEKGLKTLVLERGRDVKHGIDYKNSLKNPWDYKYRLNNNIRDIVRNPIQSGHFNEASKDFYVNDLDHPYIQETAFKWVRGYQVGGRSLTWGRQSYRWSDLYFEANIKDAIAVDWPLRYNDLASWYDYVEDFVGVSGQAENITQLPDGIFLPPIEMNCIEQHLANEVKKKFHNIYVTHGRVANLTKKKLGRGPCQFVNRCDLGCSFGGYFSSNSATLPAAMATGNLTLRPYSIVKEVLYDEKQNKAIGIKMIDSETMEEITFYSKIIFLNASTIATASILLNSISKTFPNGLGNTSGQVGHNLMDHVITSGTIAEFDGYNDSYYFGRSPGLIFIPRFQNLDEISKNKKFIRGYALQGKGWRSNWSDNHLSGFGKEFKEKITKPGKWNIYLGSRGETLPYFENMVSLDDTRKDKWGLPLVKIFFKYGKNEIEMIKHIKESTEDILRKSGFSNIKSYRSNPFPGSAVHEMGTARMGRDPKTSVLNSFNQMHDVKNVFITDGSCMTSSACQNPSLTYMALTARACDYAVNELKKGNL